MTLKKKHPSDRNRSYDTFEDSSASSGQNTSSQKSDKVELPGEEAQRLSSSQGFWRDEDEQHQRQSSSRPQVMGNELEARGPYQDDPSDPPPIYTPSDTTATATSTPPSPVAARAQPHLQDVGDHPSSPTTDSHFAERPSSQEAPAEPRRMFEEAEEDMYASSPLLERAEGHHQPQVARSSRCHWRSDYTKDRDCKRRRFKKGCWFAFALVLCLWLMIPGLMSDKARTHSPGWWHNHRGDNLDQSPLPSNPSINRSYTRHETSQSISGTYPLYDLLDLSTTSGSIAIDVEPHPGTAPAVLKLSTRSGSISVRMGGRSILPYLPSSDATNRTFETRIQTQSGSVGGSLLAGNGGHTIVESASASISLTIHALEMQGGAGADEKKGATTSRLTTTSQSGSQDISVHSASGEHLRNWEAEHVAKGSASLNIAYPRNWMGVLTMKSYGSGSVNVQGENLVVESRSQRELLAWRGDRHGKTVSVIGKGSGSATFRC